jgi:thiol-disulfide isomerase/thioredoxin
MRDILKLAMKTLCILAVAMLLTAAAFLPNICLRVSLARLSDINQPEPSIALMKVSDVVRLREQARGKVLVINFWATWCHGCVAEFPEFVALDKEYRNKGVKIVGISLDGPSDIDSKVVPFIKKSGAQFDIRVPDMADPQPVIDQFTPEWTGAMPVTLIFDRDGALVYKRFGVIDRAQVVSEVERLQKS